MSAAVAAAAASAIISGYRNSSENHQRGDISPFTYTPPPQMMQDSSSSAAPPPPPLSRYESQKRRDWNTFGQYLRNHRPPLTLSRCSGAHVLEFLRYLDQFGKTKVHWETCAYFGNSHPPGPCPCPLKQAWGSLDALIGRLRAAFEENGGSSEMNPFGVRAVRLYLREVRDAQARARGIGYEKKKRRNNTNINKTHQKQQSGSMVMMMEEQVHDVSSRVVYSGYGGGFVHLSDSNGTDPAASAVSYFST